MLEEARRDIRAGRREADRRRRDGERLAAVVRALDGLLFQLEELNLQGVDRVPTRLRERVEAILDSLPPQPEDPDFRVRYRVVPMMDVLFRAQEIVFKLRDPDRPSEDEDLDLEA
jgi:hypothetical protein